MGATTIWERWNSIRPDGSFNPANMNSLNHYAYGSIGNWLYTKLCGLEILEPGYKKFALRPQFIKGITHAELTYESVYGKIAIAWRCEGGKITVDATIPANTTAELTLPEQTEMLTLGSGSYHYEYATETSLEIDRFVGNPAAYHFGASGCTGNFCAVRPRILVEPNAGICKERACYRAARLRRFHQTAV